MLSGVPMNLPPKTLCGKERGGYCVLFVSDEYRSDAIDDLISLLSPRVDV